MFDDYYEENSEMDFEEAIQLIMEKIRESFSVLEDHGLIQTLWDENGDDFVEPTKKLMDLEKKGKLKSYVRDILNDYE